MSEKCFPNLLVVIGASAGGLEPISDILRRLPDDFQGTIFIATHRRPEFGNMLADILESRTDIKVTTPVEGETIHCTTIYIGNASDVIEVEGDYIGVELDSQRIRKLQRIDDLFFSAARSGRENTVGIILSGFLWDGVKGLKEIARRGGRCIAQDPKEADFGDMPRNAIAEVEMDFVGSTKEIAELLIEWADGRNCEV